MHASGREKFKFRVAALWPVRRLICVTLAFHSPKKHNFLPFKDKLELIRKCEAGIVHSVVALQMGVPRSTVSIIWKNRDKYCETAASCKCFY
ncbi:hypothetical protein E2C01_084300 [Portunus trituberculatus]|uniref:HTH psq-type domain-containing protein n=1 Tax=Portunus trituberculatus TaxID=210409 RepID=A0A5B7J8V7_PORTR|nr:hypothetical protein [Portunus trituberculatus]